MINTEAINAVLKIWDKVAVQCLTEDDVRAIADVCSNVNVDGALALYSCYGSDLVIEVTQCKGKLVVATITTVVETKLPVVRDADGVGFNVKATDAQIKEFMKKATEDGVFGSAAENECEGDTSATVENCTNEEETVSEIARLCDVLGCANCPVREHYTDMGCARAISDDSKSVLLMMLAKEAEQREKEKEAALKEKAEKERQEKAVSVIKDLQTALNSIEAGWIVSVRGKHIECVNGEKYMVSCKKKTGYYVSVSQYIQYECVGAFTAAISMIEEIYKEVV